MKDVLTIDVKTWAVTNARLHRQHIVETPFGVMNQTPGYIRGWCGYNPRHVPALTGQPFIPYDPVYYPAEIWWETL